MSHNTYIKEYYVPYEKTINITEKRAPTDASVKLLKEMEESAKAKLLASYPLESNVLKGHVFISKNVFFNSFEVTVLISLNGETITEVIHLDCTTYRIQEAINKVKEVVSNAITTKFLLDNLLKIDYNGTLLLDNIGNKK